MLVRTAVEVARPPARTLVLAVTASVLVVVVLLSLAVGTKPIPLGTVIDAFTDFDPSARSSDRPRPPPAAHHPRRARRRRARRRRRADAGRDPQPPRRPRAARRERRRRVRRRARHLVPSASGRCRPTSGSPSSAPRVASVLVYALGSMGRGGANAGPPRPRRRRAAPRCSASLTGAVALLDRQTLDQFRFWVVGSLAGRDADVIVAGRCRSSSSASCSPSAPAGR